MATLTFAGGVALEPPSFAVGAWPFNGTTVSPFLGGRAIPFYSVVLEPPAFTTGLWPYNGGTISPARGGSALLTTYPSLYYWSD